MPKATSKRNVSTTGAYRRDSDSSSTTSSGDSTPNTSRNTTRNTTHNTPMGTEAANRSGTTDEDVSLKPLDNVRILPKSKYGTITKVHSKYQRLECKGRVLADIKRLQRTTKLACPKLPFGRLVKEISQEHGEFRFEAVALEALHEASEYFLVSFLSDSQLLTRHRNRVTLGVEDMELLRTLAADYLPALR